jgi:hypothetical protein
MADIYGKNYHKANVEVPRQLADSSEIGGGIHRIYEEFDASLPMALSDRLLGPKVPQGAMVVDAKLHISDSLGVGVNVSFGYGATTKESDGSVLAEDLSAFIAASPVNTVGIVRPVAESAMFETFGQDTDIIGEITGGPIVPVAGAKIIIELIYVN